MNKIRIPAEWLKALVQELETNPDMTSMTFESSGGNVLVATRVRIPDMERDRPLGRDVDSWDFEYNPGD